MKINSKFVRFDSTPPLVSKVWDLKKSKIKESIEPSVTNSHKCTNIIWTSKLALQNSCCWYTDTVSNFSTLLQLKYLYHNQICICHRSYFKENMYSYLTSTDARQTLRWRRLLTTSKNTEGRFSKQGSPMREELRPRPFGITFFGAKSLGWSVWLWKHRNACITGEHPFLMYIEFSIWSEIKRWWFDFF